MEILSPTYILSHSSPRVAKWNRMLGKCISKAGTHGYTHKFTQSVQTRSCSQSIRQSPKRAELRERTLTISCNGDRWWQIVDFRGHVGWIKPLYLIFKCGTKTKLHFGRILGHLPSHRQLNLKPNRPEDLVGCKVPIDFVKTSVNEPMQIGFIYKSWSNLW